MTGECAPVIVVGGVEHECRKFPDSVAAVLDAVTVTNIDRIWVAGLRTGKATLMAEIALRRSEIIAALRADKSNIVRVVERAEIQVCDIVAIEPDDNLETGHRRGKGERKRNRANRWK